MSVAIIARFIMARLLGEEQTKVGSCCHDKIMDGTASDECGHLALGWPPGGDTEDTLKL